jgi:hypothetical protein
MSAQRTGTCPLRKGAGTRRAHRRGGVGSETAHTTTETAPGEKKKGGDKPRPCTSLDPQPGSASGYAKPSIFSSLALLAFSTSACRLPPWESMVTTTGKFLTLITHSASGTPNSLS